MKKLGSFILFLILPMILNAQWVQTNLNPGIGYCLFSDDTTIYAGTDIGVYYTNDIGDPWFSIGPEDWIFSVISVGNTIIAGSGAGKGIWISSDLGENWMQGSGIDNQSVYALCKKDTFVFAGTWGGGVFRSGDNGSSWQLVGLDSEPVEAMFSIGDLIFAGGSDIEGGKVYFSANHGDSWDYRYLPYPVSRIYCFAYKDDKVFAGTDGGLYSSDDLGESWSLEYGATFDSYGNVIDTKMFKDLIVYDQYLIAAIMFNSIWISSNNGKDWASFNEGLISDWTFYGLDVKDPYLWSLREAFGNAYRRLITDLVTSIHTTAITLPSDNTLYQNYPNPFNSTTKIKYETLQRGCVNLKVYDILGNEIVTLVNEEYPEGTYEINFNASNLSSGVYFYTLEIGDYFFETKRMLLLR